MEIHFLVRKLSPYGSYDFFVGEKKQTFDMKHGSYKVGPIINGVTCKTPTQMLHVGNIHLHFPLNVAIFDLM